MDFLSPVQAEWRAESGHGCHIFLSMDALRNHRYPDLLITDTEPGAAGDDAALEQLSKQVYDELRRMARRHMKSERQGQHAANHGPGPRSLSAPGRCDESRMAAARAVLRHGGANDAAHPGGRRPRRASHKRGGMARTVNFDETAIVVPAAGPFRRRFGRRACRVRQVAPRQAKVVELRYFGGLHGRRNRRGSRDFAAHRPAGLGFCPGLAIARARTLIGPWRAKYSSS